MFLNYDSPMPLVNVQKGRCDVEKNQDDSWQKGDYDERGEKPGQPFRFIGLCHNSCKVKKKRKK